MIKDRSHLRIFAGLLIAVGVWLMVSTSFISFSGGALVSLFISASLIVLAGLIQLASVSTLPSWVVAYTGIWLCVSVFAFTLNPGSSINQLVSAVVVICLASWATILADDLSDQPIKPSRTVRQNRTRQLS